MLKRWVNAAGIWLSDGVADYAAEAKAQHADHRVTVSSDPDVEMVFHLA